METPTLRPPPQPPKTKTNVGESGFESMWALVSPLQQQKVFVPKFWDMLRVLNRLVRVNHMYSFSQFYSI